MITQNGRYHIKRFFGGQVASIGSSIAMGIGASTPGIDDSKLNFEVSRADVTSTSFNFATNSLTWKAKVPEALSAKIYELALFSLSVNTSANDAGDKMLVSFDSAFESWGDATWSTVNTRVGTDSLRQAPTGGATVTNEFIGSFNFGVYSDADQFIIAYNNADTNTAAVEVRFEVDDTNYYRYTVTNPTAGYKIATIVKANMVSVGTPSWDKVVKIQVSTTSKAGVVSTVDWDGIRVADTDTVNPNYVLVARETLETPFIIKGGSVSEIEFSMAITV